MTVYELSRAQVDELKENYFYSEETCHLVPDNIDFYDELPDSVVQNHFKETIFTDDDFSFQG